MALLRAYAPSFVTAFGTDSSSATLPVTLRCAKRQGVQDSVANFVLPLGATVNMNGTALYEALIAAGVPDAVDVEIFRDEAVVDRIIAAAIEFLWDRPYRELTAGELMQRTGLSRPAFYQYFRNVNDLVTTLLEDLLTAMVEAACSSKNAKFVSGNAASSTSTAILSAACEMVASRIIRDSSSPIAARSRASKASWVSPRADSARFNATSKRAISDSTVVCARVASPSSADKRADRARFSAAR